MKKTLLIILVLTISSLAQVSQQWVQIFDPIAGNVFGLAVDQAGNSYITGYRTNVGTGADIVIIKYSASGDQLWLRDFAGQGTSYDVAFDITTDNNNNIYVTGKANGNIVTIKYNSEGTQQWASYYDFQGNSSFEQGTAIISDQQGNVFVTGQSENTPGSSEFIDIVTIKYSTDGVEQWNKRYNGPSDGPDYPYAIDVDQTGNSYVTGTSREGDQTDLVVLKYDEFGNQQWVQRFDRGNGADIGYDIKSDANGNVYVTGGSFPDPNNYFDYVTIKFNSAGQLLWSKFYAGLNAFNDVAYSLALDAAGNVFITGYSGDTDFSEDWVTIKYDQNGNQQWLQRKDFISGSNIPKKIKTGIDGSVYATGSARVSGSYVSYFTIKYSNDGNEQWGMQYVATQPVSNDGAVDLQVDDNSNVYVTGTSSLKFATIKYTQGLNLTSPIAGEKWIAGEKDTIRWTGGQTGQFLQIDYSDDNGQTYIQIDSGFPADSNYYVWNIPKDILTTKALIKLTDVVYPEDSIVGSGFKIKGYILTRMSGTGNYDPYSKFRDPYAFGNDSASVWPVEFWQNFDYYGTDPFTGYSYVLGVPLVLLLQTTSSDHSDWVSWVRTFGISACYYNTSFPPVYSRTALVKWIDHSGDWGGSCFGISTSNILLFKNRTEFQNNYPSFPTSDPLQILPDDTVRTVINELFTHQQGLEHKNYRNTVGLLKTPNETLRDIKTMLLDDDPLVRTLSINSNDSTDPGGHSIIVYKVEQDTNLSNIFYVFTYDNAYPNNLDSAIIIVDTLANNSNGTWTPIYGWTNWGGTKWFYLRDPAISYFVNPTMPKQSSLQSQFILGENELQILNTRNSSIKIIDSQGNSSGYVNGVLQDNIPGCFPNIIENGSPGPPIGYDLPTAKYSVQMSDFENANTSVSFYTGNKTFKMFRGDAQNSDIDRFFFDGGVSTVNPDQQDKSLNLINIINETIQEKTFFITELDLSQNDSVKIVNVDDNTLNLISYGSAKDYQLEISNASELGLGIFQNSTIQLTQNTTHKFEPNWSDLTNSQLTIYVDFGNDGTIDDTLFVANTVDVKDEGSMLSPNEFNLAHNYPNPFNPTTTIQYSIPQRSNVILKVYDVLGNEVAVLVDEERERGVFSVNFNASQLASGIYFYKLQAGSFAQTKKMIILR